MQATRGNISAGSSNPIPSIRRSTSTSTGSGTSPAPSAIISTRSPGPADASHGATSIPKTGTLGSQIWHESSASRFTSSTNTSSGVHGGSSSTGSSPPNASANRSSSSSSSTST